MASSAIEAAANSMGGEGGGDYRWPLEPGSLPRDWDDDFLVRWVHTHLPRSLRRAHPAADIIQCIRLRIWQKQSQFRGQSAQQYRVWVLKIARNCIIDNWRKGRRTCPCLGEFCESEARGLWNFEPSEADPLTVAIGHEQQQLLEAALESLPAQTRQILRLRFIEEWTFGQIAAELHLPVTTCRRRCEHACLHLSQRLHACRV